MEISMERLTYRDEQGNAHTKRDSSYFGILEKLAQYEDLEEQKLILKLPCKIGDTVYALTPFCEICEEALDNEYACENCCKGYYPNETKFDYEMISMVGKRVFLTEQEAQAALEKMKGDGVNG